MGNTVAVRLIDRDSPPLTAPSPFRFRWQAKALGIEGFGHTKTEAASDWKASYLKAISNGTLVFLEVP